MTVYNNLSVALFKHDLLLREFPRATFGRSLRVGIVSDPNSGNESECYIQPKSSVLLINLTNMSSEIGYMLALVRAQAPEIGVVGLYREIQHCAICELLAKGVHGFLRYDLIKRDLVPALRALASTLEQPMKL
jgi:hypothetical protein